MSYFRNSCTGAPIVCLLTRSGTPDPSNGLASDLNWNTAAEREDVGDVALRQQRGIRSGAFLEFQRGRAEHASRLCLSTRHLHLLRRPLLIAKNDQHLPGAIDHGDRGVVALALTLG